MCVQVCLQGAHKYSARLFYMEYALCIHNLYGGYLHVRMGHTFEAVIEGWLFNSRPLYHKGHE